MNVRFFLALWPDLEVQCVLARLQERAEIRAAGGRPVSTENLHITLQFIGVINFSQQAAIIEWLPEFDFEPVNLMLDRLGYWPRSGILWLGSKKTPHELVKSVQRLSNRLRGFGISLDHRGFKVHITLARDARAVKRFEFEPLMWSAQEVVLVASETLSGSSHYSVLVSSGTA